MLEVDTLFGVERTVTHVSRISEIASLPDRVHDTGGPLAFQEAIQGHGISRPVNNPSE